MPVFLIGLSRSSRHALRLPATSFDDCVAACDAGLFCYGRGASDVPSGSDSESDSKSDQGRWEKVEHKRERRSQDPHVARGCEGKGNGGRE